MERTRFKGGSDDHLDNVLKTCLTGPVPGVGNGFQPLEPLQGLGDDRLCLVDVDKVPIAPLRCCTVPPCPTTSSGPPEWRGLPHRP